MDKIRSAGIKKDISLGRKFVVPVPEQEANRNTCKGFQFITGIGPGQLLSSQFLTGLGQFFYILENGSVTPSWKAFEKGEVSFSRSNRTQSSL